MTHSETVTCCHCHAETTSNIILLGKGRKHLCAACDFKLLRSGRIVAAELKNTRYYALSYAISAITDIFSRPRAKSS